MTSNTMMSSCTVFPPSEMVLGWRAAKCRQSAEAFRQVLTDREIFFGAERSAAIVVERQKYLDQVHYAFPLFGRGNIQTLSATSGSIFAQSQWLDPGTQGATDSCLHILSFARKGSGYG